MEIRRSSTETKPTDETNRNPATTEGRRKRQFSAETKAKLSAAHKGEKNPMYGKKGEKNPMYGKKHSAETRAKISEALKGEKHYKWDENITQIKQAIARVAIGSSMKESSLDTGFSAGWLSNWKMHHPERYRLILAEEMRKLEQEQVEKKLGNATLVTVEMPDSHEKERLSAKTRAKMSAARKVSAETRAKMSAALKGERHPHYGKNLSAEHRAKIGAANKGKKHSAETRAKMSATNKGEKNPMYGKNLSVETRAKMSAARKGEKHPNWHKNIEQVRLAIAHVAAGQTMQAASLETGFSTGWLYGWKKRHPEKYRLILAEDISKLKQKQTELNAARKDKKLSAGTRTKSNTTRKDEKQPNYDKTPRPSSMSNQRQQPETPIKRQIAPRLTESLTLRQLLIRKIRQLTDELQDADGLVSFSQLGATLDKGADGEAYSYGDDLHFLAEIICQRKALLLID